MVPTLQSRGTEHVHTNHGQVTTCTYKLVLRVPTVIGMGKIGCFALTHSLHNTGFDGQALVDSRKRQDLR